MLGEKIRTLFRNGGPPPNGEAGRGIPLQPAAAHPPTVAPETGRRSNGLREFFQNLHGETGLRILDLGGVSQANVNFITSLGHKIYTEDLLIGLERLLQSARDGGSRNGLAGRLIEENLNFPRSLFDGILVWDTLEFLDEEMLPAAVAQIQSILKPGGTLLTFFHTHAKGETVHLYRYQIHDRQSLQLQPRFSRPLPRAFNNRSLERLFGGFRSVKFFLAKDSLREVIVTR